MLQLTRRLIRYRDALAVLAGVDLKTTVATTRLGWVWWIVDPLVMMAIYYFVVKVMFDRGGENYHLFVLTGIVAWQFFAKTVRLASDSLLRNKHLLTHTNVPLELFAIVPALIQGFFALIGFVIIAVWSGSALNANVLSMFPILFVVGLFAVALGGAMSICVVFVPDVSKFIDYGLRIGFFVTPILYPASTVAETNSIPRLLKTLYFMNPMQWAVSSLRETVLHGNPLNVGEYCLWLAIAMVALQVCTFFVRRNRQAVMKHL